MFALSRAMYLFEVNLNPKTNTSTPDVSRCHLEYKLTACGLYCSSTGLTEREIPMQCYSTTEMYTDNCTET